MHYARVALPSLVFFGCLSLGCTSSPPAGDPPAKEAGKADAKADAKATPDAAPVTEQEARAVFDAWVKAQTDKDFEGYSKLYAEDFKGIKRNGARTLHLEREEWLSKRQKQLKRGYSITATGLKLKPRSDREPGTMVATFTQRWVTPTYADVGPKELIIARRASAAVISHEEMISSHVTRRKGRTDSPMLVLDIGKARYAVLTVGRPNWADNSKGAPSLLDDETVRGPLALDRVEKAMPGVVGREVDVREPDGSTCRAKIEGLELVGRADSISYKDELFEDEVTEGGEIAQMWEEMSSETLLLGRLNACTGALAVSAEAAEFAGASYFTKADALDDALATKVQDAFRALPKYADEQKSYTDEMAEYGSEEEGEGKPPERWDDKEGQRVTQLWTAGDERFVFTSVSVGEGCGDWVGSLWAMWTVGEGDALELVGSGPESGDFSGMSALKPEHFVRWHDALWLLTASELYEVRPKPKGDATLIYATEPMFFGCAC